jgi:hypothetical protein
MFLNRVPVNTPNDQSLPYTDYQKDARYPLPRPSLFAQEPKRMVTFSTENDCDQDVTLGRR